MNKQIPCANSATWMKALLRLTHELTYPDRRCNHWTAARQ